MPTGETFLGGQCASIFAQPSLLAHNQRLHTGHTARLAEQDFVFLTDWYTARGTDSFSQQRPSCLDKFGLQRLLALDEFSAFAALNLALRGAVKAHPNRRATAARARQRLWEIPGGSGS